MCDTVAVVPKAGPVWFAKNSDREPSEAQFFECHGADADTADRPKGLPEPERAYRLLISRPCWMWGAEMGVNEHSVAIGNEAVFTRESVAKQGYSGMDFLRVALEQAKTADEALEALIELVEQFVQGGRMAHRQLGFRYHSSFLIADPNKAWVLESAGHFWAAKEVRGAATISNALTIDDEFNRVHQGAYAHAKKRGWVNDANAFNFAEAFGDRVMTALGGGRIRQACTLRALSGVTEPLVSDFIRTLSDHGDETPTSGWRSLAPCAHASLVPTRHAAQTTASVIARLGPSVPQVWATGTSAPCLSVFKPARFDTVRYFARPISDSTFADDELWWSHERLHRLCLVDYENRRGAFEEQRNEFQEQCLRQVFSNPWAKHQELVTEWTRAAKEQASRRLWRPARMYWNRNSRKDQMPVGQLTPVPPSPQ